MKVDTHLGYDIIMRGFNNFSCPYLKLFGYSTVAQIKKAITKKVDGQPKNACPWYSL